MRLRFLSCCWYHIVKLFLRLGHYTKTLAHYLLNRIPQHMFIEIKIQLGRPPPYYKTKAVGKHQRTVGEHGWFATSKEANIPL